MRIGPIGDIPKMDATKPGVGMMHHPCPRCSGTGIITFTNATGATETRRCVTCHGTGNDPFHFADPSGPGSGPGGEQFVIK